MADRPKVIELIKRLDEAFPNSSLISICKEFQRFGHYNNIKISYQVYVSDCDFKDKLYGISAVEAHVDAIIINKVNQEGE